MARIRVRLTPRGGGDAIDGWTDRDGEQPVLRVRVAAAPVDGAANDALLRLLAKKLAVPRSGVAIVGGAQSRDKLVDVSALSRDEVDSRIAAACVTTTRRAPPA